MGHRPQVRRSLAVGRIQNELGNANEAGLTELTRGQVWSPNVDSLDSLDSIDSIESPDSLDSLDSLRPTHSLSLSPHSSLTHWVGILTLLFLTKDSPFVRFGGAYHAGGESFVRRASFRFGGAYHAVSTVAYPV